MSDVENILDFRYLDRPYLSKQRYPTGTYPKLQAKKKGPFRVK